MIIWKNQWHGSRFFTPMARKKLHPLILRLDCVNCSCACESDIIAASLWHVASEAQWQHGVILCYTSYTYTTYTIYDIPWISLILFAHWSCTHGFQMILSTKYCGSANISSLLDQIDTVLPSVQERLSSVWEALWSRKQSNRPVFVREPSPLQQNHITRKNASDTEEVPATVSCTCRQGPDCRKLWCVLFHFWWTLNIL